MVRHIVIWRLKEEAKQSDWDANLTRIRQIVDAMRTHVPALLRLELGVNQGKASDAADLLLFSEFEDWEALPAYEFHPLHGELRRLIGPLRCERRVLDYELRFEPSTPSVYRTTRSGPGFLQPHEAEPEQQTPPIETRLRRYSDAP